MNNMKILRIFLGIIAKLDYIFFYVFKGLFLQPMCRIGIIFGIANIFIYLFIFFFLGGGRGRERVGGGGGRPDIPDIFRG